MVAAVGLMFHILDKITFADCNFYTKNTTISMIGGKSKNIDLFILSDKDEQSESCLNSVGWYLNNEMGWKNISKQIVGIFTLQQMNNFISRIILRVILYVHVRIFK